MAIKLGIVGVRGLSYLDGILDIPEFKLEAICDIDENVIKKAAAEHGIPKTYRVYDDMLDSDIDAVFIATPMQFHGMQTLMALEADKHVLCEVTAATNINELFWLKEAVEKSNKIFMMCENYCYRPDAILAKRLVEEGYLGEVYYAETEYIEDLKSWLVYPNGKKSWRQTWQLGKRGSFYPTHSIGPIMKCFGNDRIKEVSCFGVGPYTAPEFRQEDTTTTMVRLQSGKLIEVRVDCVSNRPNQIFTLMLQGTKGAIESPRGPFGQQDMYRAYFSDGSTITSRGVKWENLWDYAHLLPKEYQKMPERAAKLAMEGDYSCFGGNYFVVHDFYKALKGEIDIPVNIYEACEWTAVALLSEISAENNGRTMTMPNFRGTREDMELKL